MAERIAKFLARCGVASRREAETLIKQGRIVVNGEEVLTPAFLVEGNENILFDGEKVNKKEKPVAETKQVENPSCSSCTYALLF